jgi:hypothetical protein
LDLLSYYFPQEWGDQWAMHTLWSHSEWPIKAISENRNGQLGKYLECIRKEFDYAYPVEMPQVDGKCGLGAVKRCLAKMDLLTGS